MPKLKTKIASPEFYRKQREQRLLRKAAKLLNTADHEKLKQYLGIKN